MLAASTARQQRSISFAMCGCVRHHIWTHCEAQVPLAFLLLEKAAGEDPRIVGIALLPLLVQTVTGQGTPAPLNGLRQLLPLQSPSGVATPIYFS